MPNQIHNNDIKRFWSYVQKTDGCWNWVGTKNPGGYGRFYTKGKRPVAHRYSYELQVGKILDGYELDHLCKNTSCVNPIHLEVVTPRENTHRSNTVTKKKSGLPLGVNKHGRWFRAKKYINGKTRHIGLFDTPEKAHSAYINYEGGV